MQNISTGPGERELLVPGEVAEDGGGVAEGSLREGVVPASLRGVSRPPGVPGVEAVSEGVPQTLKFTL